MQSSDDDLQTTLSKWPFILGDVLLVGTALAIAILGQWQLTNWQVASCVISVALGAGLFVLPYIVEFRVRVREEAEDKSADLRILQRHVVGTETQLEAVAERIDSLEAGLTNLAQAKPDLSTPIQAIEGKIKPLASKQLEQFRQLEALAAKVDALAKSQKATSVEPIAKKTREPRQRRTPEPRLLKRAIGEKQDNSSAAVSRIIESKIKQAESAPQEKPIADELPSEPAPKELKAEETEESTGGAAEQWAEVVEPEALQTEDTLIDAAPVQPKQRVRTKKSDTAIIASVFIGIGNKPFVRGSGAGLKWDSGIAMEFEEIGKWRWIAPADMEDSVEFQLFRNDEDPDTAGKYTLAPGQQLNLSPLF